MRLRHIPGCEQYIDERDDCISQEEAISYKGTWHDMSRNRPIYIEIGCGKGAFIRENARRNPNIFYVGIERYESVLYKAVKRRDAEDNIYDKKDNLFFMTADAEKLLDIFKEGEVERIYLNFSDPWPKLRHENRRLTSPHFLDIYDKILCDDGRIEFKTDNNSLYEYSLEMIKDARWDIIYQTRDLHGDTKAMQDNIMTEYEAKFSSKGNNINKLIAIKGGKYDNNN